MARCASTGSTSTTAMKMASERDLIELLEADIGIAVVPDAASIPPTLKRATVEELDDGERCTAMALPAANVRRWRPR